MLNIQKTIRMLKQLGYTFMQKRTIDELQEQFEKEFSNETLTKKPSGRYCKIATELLWCSYKQCAIANKLVKEI